MAPRRHQLVVIAAALLFGLFSSAGQAQPAQVNTIKDVFAKLRTCWKPPPPSRANPGIDITVIVSFNRAGGTTSMARASSPDSGDSQFFICFDDASFLNNQYTVWGKVTSGMENVDKLKKAPPGSRGGEVTDPDKIVKARMALDDAA